MLGDLTDTKVEQLGPSSGSEFIYVDISSVDNKTKRIAWPKRVDFDSAPSRARQRLKAGDVLVSMTRPNLNSVAMVTAELEGAIGSTGFHALRATEKVLPGWLYYGVQTRSFIEAMSSMVQGALYPAVRPRDIQAFDLPTPPVKDQRRIVAEIEKQLSRLDAAVSNLNRVKAHLKRYRDSVLRTAVEQRLIVVASRERWNVVALSEAADVQLGQQRAPVHAAATERVPYIRAANVTWEGLDLRDVKLMGFPNQARYRLRSGDLLLAEASGSASEVGRPAIWQDEVPGACYQKTLIRIRANTEFLLPKFVYYYFLHTSLSGQFAKLAPGVGILHHLTA